MNRIFVLVGAKSVECHWQHPPPGSERRQWSQRVYYHPDVEIFIGKTPGRERINYQTVDHAIMVALEDAHMAVNALRRGEKTARKKRGKKCCPGVLQLELFPE